MAEFNIREQVKELAQRLEGSEYGFDLAEIQESIISNYRLVVMWGHSDDLLEIRGAIHDEFGAYDGRTIKVTREGLIENKCSEDDCPYYREQLKKGIEITLNWNDCPPDGYPPWTIETEIPHEKFMIYEDGNKQSEGIVFCLYDVPESSQGGSILDKA